MKRACLVDDDDDARFVRDDGDPEPRPRRKRRPLLGADTPPRARLRRKRQLLSPHASDMRLWLLLRYAKGALSARDTCTGAWSLRSRAEEFKVDDLIGNPESKSTGNFEKIIGRAVGHARFEQNSVTNFKIPLRDKKTGRTSRSPHPFLLVHLRTNDDSQTWLPDDGEYDPDLLALPIVSEHPVVQEHGTRDMAAPVALSLVAFRAAAICWAILGHPQAGLEPAACPAWGHLSVFGAEFIDLSWAPTIAIPPPPPPTFGQVLLHGYVDAVPISGLTRSAKESVILFTWAPRHAMENIHERRIFTCMKKSQLCGCGCSGRHTIEEVEHIAAWDVHALELKTHPCQGPVGHELPPQLQKRAGKRLKTRGCAVSFGCDWEAKVDFLGTKRWDNIEAPCDTCSTNRDEMHSYSTPPKPLRKHDDWLDAITRSCIEIVPDACMAESIQRAAELFVKHAIVCTCVLCTCFRLSRVCVCVCVCVCARVCPLSASMHARLHTMCI